MYKYYSYSKNWLWFEQLSQLSVWVKMSTSLATVENLHGVKPPDLCRVKISTVVSSDNHFPNELSKLNVIVATDNAWQHVWTVTGLGCNISLSWCREALQFNFPLAQWRHNRGLQRNYFGTVTNAIAACTTATLKKWQESLELKYFSRSFLFLLNIAHFNNIKKIFKLKNNPMYIKGEVMFPLCILLNRVFYCQYES